MENGAPRSFGKSLYFGHIPESLVVPYPRLRAEERDALTLILDQFRKFAAGEVDSRKIDDEAKLPAHVLEGMRDLGLFGLYVGGYALLRLVIEHWRGDDAERGFVIPHLVSTSQIIALVVLAAGVVVLYRVGRKKGAT